jgi:hypothetical protein
LNLANQCGQGQALPLHLIQKAASFQKERSRFHV